MNTRIIQHALQVARRRGGTGGHRLGQRPLLDGRRGGRRRGVRLRRQGGLLAREI